MKFPRVFVYYEIIFNDWLGFGGGGGGLSLGFLFGLFLARIFGQILRDFGSVGTYRHAVEKFKIKTGA